VSSNNYKQVQSQLGTLKLNGMLNGLDLTVEKSEKKTTSHLCFLKSLLLQEISYRNEKRLQRNLVGAHFPIIKRLEEFRYTTIEGFTKSDSVMLKDLRWLDNYENMLFLGPPGIGKTHLAISCGMLAVEAGYTVCFERAVNLFKLLKTSELQRKSGFRIKKIMKSHLIIIDEIGYTPIERREANLFFSLISEIFEKSSIIITSNKGFGDWAEMMGDEIMTTALLDRLLHNAKVFNMKGDSGR
jgi:DNA replication protein DnaC